MLCQWRVKLADMEVSGGKNLTRQKGETYLESQEDIVAKPSFIVGAVVFWSRNKL